MWCGAQLHLALNEVLCVEVGQRCVVVATTGFWRRGSHACLIFLSIRVDLSLSLSLGMYSRRLVRWVTKGEK